MLNSLKNLSSERIEQVLASLIQRFLPQPRDEEPEALPNDLKELQDSVLAEIQGSLKIDPSDHSSTAKAKILEFLAKEMSEPIISGARGEQAKIRLGQRGNFQSMILDAESGMYRVEGSPATLWLSASFAHQWYEDALAEARAGDTFQHRRREILFAVCAVESYLFEWVRDDVLRRDFTALNAYLLLGSHKGIKDRWKEVLKDLHERRLIPKYPAMSTRVWNDFVVLVNYRNGLVHASVSRPEPDELPLDWLRLSTSDLEKLTTVPSKSARDTVVSGWATRVVTRLITHLHSEIGTQPPEWLTEP